MNDNEHYTFDAYFLVGLMLLAGNVSILLALLLWLLA